MNDYSSAVILRDLRARIESYKVVWDLSLRETGALLGSSYAVNGAPLSYKWYDRRIYHTFGSIDPFAGQSNVGLSVSQMTQGAALLSSYK